MHEFTSVCSKIKSIPADRRPAEKDALIAWVTSDRSLNGTDLAVFNRVLLKLHWGSGHTFEIGRNDLAQALGRPRSSISRSLAKLKQRKYIDSYSERIGAMHTRSVYTFPPMLTMHLSFRIKPYPNMLEAIAAADQMDRNAKADEIARVAHTLGGPRLMRVLLEDANLAVVRYWIQMGLAPGDFARILFRHAIHDRSKKPIGTWHYFQAEVDEVLAEARKETGAAAQEELTHPKNPKPADACKPNFEDRRSTPSDLRDAAE
jgi:hypothetical protein